MCYWLLNLKFCRSHCSPCQAELGCLDPQLEAHLRLFLKLLWGVWEARESTGASQLLSYSVASRLNEDLAGSVQKL